MAEFVVGLRQELCTLKEKHVFLVGVGFPGLEKENHRTPGVRKGFHFGQEMFTCCLIRRIQILLNQLIVREREREREREGSREVEPRGGAEANSLYSPFNIAPPKESSP